MIQISRIVKKWCENQSEETNVDSESQENQSLGTKTRDILKNTSVDYGQERKASREKFSGVLSKLAEDSSRRESRLTTPPIKEESPVVADVEIPEEEEPLAPVVEESRTPAPQESSDDWDQEMQDFTQGLFEDSSQSYDDVSSISDTFEDGLETEDAPAMESTEKKAKYIKKVASSEDRERRSPKIDRSTGNKTNDDQWNIEAVLKSMRSNEDSPIGNSFKLLRRRRDNNSSNNNSSNNSRKNSDKDKKNSRHKWV